MCLFLNKIITLLDDHWCLSYYVGVAGCFSPYVSHEIVHNRTVNLNGGVGKNIALDRACEFLNAEFKGEWMLCWQTVLNNVMSYSLQVELHVCATKWDLHFRGGIPCYWAMQTFITFQLLIAELMPNQALVGVSGYHTCSILVTCYGLEVSYVDEPSHLCLTRLM